MDDLIFTHWSGGFVDAGDPPEERRPFGLAFHGALE
jgi:hypothetical protein